MCALAVLVPKPSFADLNEIACNAVWRSCLGNCGATGNTQACTDRCDDRRATCLLQKASSKQQTPPPPCTGPLCNIRGANPPRTVSPPNLKPKPIQPVKPVGVSNPNKATPGNAPVIFERKTDSGEHGHRR